MAVGLWPRSGARQRCGLMNMMMHARPRHQVHLLPIANYFEAAKQ
jgi:hypothetical protein